MMVDLSDGSKPTGKELMVPEPVRIKVGQTYQMVWAGRIVDVKVHKITTSSYGEIGILLTKPADKKLFYGMYQPKETIAIKGSEIKDRLILGGLSEIVL